jgi:hypothetical protein
MTDPDKPWRDPNAKRMTFNEMAARAQYEWQRAEDAEAEAQTLHARADAPPTLAEAMTVPEVRALLTVLPAVLDTALRDNYLVQGGCAMTDADDARHKLEQAAIQLALDLVARLKGDTP